MPDDVPPDFWVYPLRKGDKLAGVEWIEFHLNDFLTSAFVAYAVAEGRGDDVFRALLLWSECYRQDPAGTLPDDDLILAQLARLPLADWPARRAQILHGWEPCQVETDTGTVSRLGHAKIAGIAERTHRRVRGKAAAREGQAQSLRRHRIRRHLVALGLSRMAEAAPVVDGIERWLAESGQFLSLDNVRAGAELFGGPRVVASR